MLPQAYAGIDQECQSNDPFISKVCSSINTIDKAKQFTNSYLTIIGNSNSYTQLKEAIDTKEMVRHEIHFCRMDKQSPEQCIDRLLETANNQLISSYSYIDPKSFNNVEIEQLARSKIQDFNRDYKKDSLLCLSIESKRLDDLMSPASDIAKAVTNSCKTNSIKYVTFVSSTLALTDVLDPINGMSINQINKLVDENFGENKATQTVLEARAALRDASTKREKQPIKRKKPKNM